MPKKQQIEIVNGPGAFDFMTSLFSTPKSGENMFCEISISVIITEKNRTTQKGKSILVKIAGAVRSDPSGKQFNVSLETKNFGGMKMTGFFDINTRKGYLDTSKEIVETLFA